MASRRKSTTPCMVVPSDAVETEIDVRVTDGGDSTEVTTEPSADGNVTEASRGDLEHNLHYAGEDAVTRSTAKCSSALEPVVRDSDDAEDMEEAGLAGIPLSKTPIMKMKSKSEAKRIAVSHRDEDGDAEQGDSALLTGSGRETLAKSLKPSVVVANPNLSQGEPKKALINSTAAVLPASLAQVLSALQAQQSAQTQLLIPLTSIPTYSAAMDSSPLLVNTYNRFPYPSATEMLSLAGQTKFTEEQIKIWFSAQRLKHGVSWTPEEVEEARRKQFNGTVHTVPQTITVIPAQNGLQSILQTCQFVGQPGLVLTQLGGANSLPVTTPITLTVAGVPKPAPMHAGPPPAASASENKRTGTTVQPPSLTPQENSALSAEHFIVRPKKSKEQLAELKASYMRSRFASDAEISRLMTLTGLTKGEIKKWFSDTRYNQRNSKTASVAGATIVIDSSDETAGESPTKEREKETRNKSWNPFPDFTPQKFKERTAEQVLALEESFQQCSAPSDAELSRLRAQTKLTRREIDAWFAERRKVVAGKTGSDQEEQEQESGVHATLERVGKKTPEQLHILRNAFVRSHWPSVEEYDCLAQETGLPRSYIVTWFGDSRYSWNSGSLKWYSLYERGGASEPSTLNGGRKRGRSRSQGRGKRGKRSPRKLAAPSRARSGREVLRDYYLKHGFLSEQDLDELVTKSRMSYEQVRDWFAETRRREDVGLDPFQHQGSGHEGEESQGDSEVPGEEQGGGGREEEEGEAEESDESDAWEPPRSVRRSLSGTED